MRTIFECFSYMLDNDNIISTSVSEAVEKIATDEEDYHKRSFMCFTLHSHNMPRADLYIANSRDSCLPTLGYIQCS